MNFARYVLLSAVLAKVNANCECNEVDSWDGFKDLVVAVNENQVESSSPQKIVLCPFKITKVIDENTDHWDEFLPIKKPMHITCHKQKPEDRCWIEIEGGDKCTFNQNCGRAMIKIRSSEYFAWIELNLKNVPIILTSDQSRPIDDVTIDGLKITQAKDNIINIDKDSKNIRIIDMEVFKSTIPGNNYNAPTGLISIGPEASVQIIDSLFAWNQASIVENKGSLLIHGSKMRNNYVKTEKADVSIFVECYPQSEKYKLFLTIINKYQGWSYCEQIKWRRGTHFDSH